MNERFWNLKKEKQDRMINAALKVFAEHGYYRACTDEIVREAGISKGLLFHYFVNKAGLYEFICNYSIRYMKLELSGLVNHGENNFFARCKEIAAVKSQTMKQYPYMQMFLENACEEHEEVIGTELLEALKVYREFLRELYPSKSKEEMVPEEYDPELLLKIVGHIERGVMKQTLCDPAADGSVYYQEVASMYEMLEMMKQH